MCLQQAGLHGLFSVKASGAGSRVYRGEASAVGKGFGVLVKAVAGGRTRRTC
jgi:hypothetical protein